ncbi:endo alpha-1,4 polygalactosaminidase [Streptomyces sp. PKU-EA00015]|uniref:endo alpha-1,4 polygalactosaminidase n=1 Tax=Streptomyces sp. PKU-EA00015 TaxID=2748326 RepID=UPI00159F790F|nr:endo alpha-1,4 polygalactosaminidase [Streptomyces sp. PKU-EA00015]NWF29787.1 endo alpha-1,4 polygalactosaminidase [Streptomyces sp. PKU-EA00015]
MRPLPRTRAAATAAVLLMLLSACSATTDPRPRPTAPGPDEDGVRRPAAGAVFDYQLGGAYRPTDDVEAVSRDRGAEPVPGLYNICYVNAFQTQPGAAVAWWRKKHPDLLLHGRDGELVVDEDWDEPLLDLSSAAKRRSLLGVVGPWIDGCAERGFDAVEPDNLDSYTRSDGLLSEADAIAFARLLADRAHARGLAIAQKNTAELLDGHEDIGFDFALVEECARYEECPRFTRAYDGRVFDVEYEQEDFATACRTWPRLSVVLRDRDVHPAGEPGHVRETC